MILAVDGEVREPEELATLTRQLRAELLELDVTSIEEPTVGPPPDGAKGGGAALVGQLLISLGPTSVGALIRTIGRWLSQSGARKVTVRIGQDELIVERASSAQQEQLIAAFLARHPGPTAAA
jgi:hypothetical protein